MRSIWNRELTAKRMLQDYGVEVTIVRDKIRTYKPGKLSRARIDRIRSLGEQVAGQIFVFDDRVYYPIEEVVT